MVMSIMHRRNTSSASQWRKDKRRAGVCLITDVKFITVNFLYRSVPFYECCIKIFIIQIIQGIETSGGSWLQGLSCSPHHNDYPTQWQNLHSRMFSTDFKPQNTIQQHRQRTDVNRFNTIQGPITACHFKRSYS